MTGASKDRHIKPSKLLPRERELWAEQLLIRPDWHYAETLHWIIYRDGEQVASALDYGSSPLYADRTSILEATANLTANGDDLFEPAPCMALSNAIIAGDVRALGEPPEPGPKQIAAADWYYMQFVDNVPGHRADTVVQDIRYQRPFRRLWTNLRFDRASVMAAFRNPSVHMSQPEIVTPTASPKKGGRTEARARFARVLAENPTGPPAEWRKGPAIETLARDFGLTEAEATAVRLHVFDKAAAEIKAAWRAPGAPKKTPE